MRITGSEKAFVGGLIAALATIIVQLQQSGQFTAQEFAWSVGSWILTHILVYATTNTPKSIPPAS